MVIWEATPEGRSMSPVSTPIAHGAVLDSDSSLELVGTIDDLYVSFVAGDGLVYGFSDHFLFVSTDGGKTFSRRGSLPKVDPSALDTMWNWIARSKLVRSLRDSSFPFNTVVLETGTILVFYDRIYRSIDGGWSFEAVHDYGDHPVRGGPFLGNAGPAVTDDGVVYFGEYISNEPRPNTIHIATSKDDGKTWDVAYKFEPGKIFHVHSVEYDSFRDRIWVFTGDRDHESHIYFTDDGFDTLDTIGGGAQMWRAVTGIATSKGLIWGSDNDVEGGSIYRWSENNKTVDKIIEVPGVVYYSARTASGSNLVLSTTHEPGSKYTKRFDPPAETQLWVSDSGREWSKLMKLETAFDPNIETQHKVRAAISFAAGTGEDKVFAYPFFTKAFPGKTLVFADESVLVE